MTLIGSFSRHGIPIFFSDVLLSSDSENQEDIDIPTIGNIKRINDQITYSIADIRRKVQPLPNGSFCLWSGSFHDCKIAISRLVEFLNVNPDATKFQLQPLFDSFDKAELDIGLILAFRTKERWSVGSYKAAQHSIDGFDFVRLSGSGIPNALSILNQIPPAISSDRRHREQDAIHVGFTLMAQLYGNELNSGRSLQRRFGGAYEILSCREGQYYPLGPALFLHFDIDLPNRRFSPMNKIYKVETIREFLIVQVMELSGEGLHQLTSSHHVHIIPPMFFDETSRPTEDELSSLNLDYSWICSYSVVQFDKALETSTTIKYEPGAEKSALVVQEGNQRSLCIKREYMQLIYDAQQSRVRDPRVKPEGDDL